MMMDAFLNKCPLVTQNTGLHCDIFIHADAVTERHPGARQSGPGMGNPSKGVFLIRWDTVRPNFEGHSLKTHESRCATVTEIDEGHQGEN